MVLPYVWGMCRCACCSDILVSIPVLEWCGDVTVKNFFWEYDYTFWNGTQTWQTARWHRPCLCTASLSKNNSYRSSYCYLKWQNENDHSLLTHFVLKNVRHHTCVLYMCTKFFCLMLKPWHQLQWNTMRAVQTYCGAKLLLLLILLKRFIELVQSIMQKLLTLHNWKYVT